MPGRPEAELLERAAAVLGSPVVAWRFVERGYTPAERWVLRAENGRSAFAKRALDEPFVGSLRAEHRAYSRLDLECVPDLLGWWDGDAPLLFVEDLSEADWPPPWTPEQVHRVQAMLDRLSSTPAPEWVDDLPDAILLRGGWHDVRADPEPFLSLGFVSRAWLEAALDELVAYQESAAVTGDTLVHFDVRSDNLCFDGDRTLLIDWGEVSRGSDTFDFASWLPSLHTEGGPPPWELLPDSEGMAALLSGYWAARAGLQPPERAPHVRDVQRRCLTSALAWTVTELQLPAPDGTNASELLLTRG